MDIVGRQQRGKHLFYEVRRSGRDESDTDWEMMSALERKDAYVMKMVRNFDEKLKSLQPVWISGRSPRKRFAFTSKTLASIKTWPWVRLSACRRAKESSRPRGGDVDQPAHHRAR